VSTSPRRVGATLLTFKLLGALAVPLQPPELVAWSAMA